MTRTNKLFMGLLASALTVLPAMAQENGPSQEVTISGTGGFQRSTYNGLQQSASDAGGVLFNYRYFFNWHNGIEADYGLSNNNVTYGTNSAVANVSNRSHEFSLAYVFRFPMRRVTPFLLAGASALVFEPKDFVGAGNQGRAAFAYGGGADINLSKHVYLRAEYRGFVFDSPTYGLPGLAGADRATHLAQPSLGFGYRF